MNMTALAAAVIAAVFAIGMGGLLFINGDGDDKDTISVTMGWEKDIVEEIVGDNYRVVSMMGSNVSPHEAYSTPSNISDLYGTVMYFKIGAGVEWETAFFDSVTRDIPSSVKIIDISSSIGYVPLPNTHHHHDDGDDHEEESATDPHIWTSPDILRKVAALVADVVSEADPIHASEYASNLKAYEARADAVDEKMAAIASKVGDAHVHVMVWHPAWQYLIEQYVARFGADLHQESVEEDGEVSPAEAVAIVRGEGCRSVYVSTTDEGYEGRAALTEAGIAVHVVNPTADDMLSSVSEFLSFLESDLEV
ncbi:MAG: zinc ABC transporter substrate-binding protein [Candidatus Methanomethylophilaceae archaeon]|nr:zinc ABC transporter substrate-binding protein [Candidatus Methanomethylophilaceae archaeon]